MVNWKDHCNIKPTHYDPRLFITSQWQLDRDSPSIIYLLLRVSIFLAFLVIAILTYILETEDGQKTWGIYLTNWGLSICTIQAFFSFSMLFYAVIAHYRFEKGKLVKFVSNLYWLYWMVSTIAIPLAFTISLIYWTFLYQAEYWSTMNFMAHGMNSILMFTDLCLVAHPVRLIHFVYPVGFSLIYLIFTYIYYICGGTARDGTPYIYSILKWDDVGMTAKYGAIVLVVIISFHVIAWIVQVIRKTIAKRCFSRSERKGYLYY